MPSSHAIADAAPLLPPAAQPGGVSPCRAFAARPVPRVWVEEILGSSARAPSGVNTQPWNVVLVSGAARERLVLRVRPQVDLLAADAVRRDAFWRAFDTHPRVADWGAVDVVHAADTSLTAAMGLCDDAPDTAQQALRHYFALADAPLGMFFLLHDQLGVGSVLDSGMFLQNVVMLARARGLQAVVQTGWRGVSEAVLAELAPPPAMWLLAAVALGFPEPGGAACAAEHATVPDMAGRTRWHG